MTDEPTVLLRREGAAATIVLNRPEALNAWNRRLGEELRAALADAADDPAVRAVMVTGAGRAFSSGADLRDILEDDRTPEGHPDVRRVLAERYHPIITDVREMPKPVLAAVNGPVVGIGLSLALACDLVVARASAYLMLAFVNIGLAPDGGSSLFVPARAGFARAAEMALLGERIPAAQALEWGLVNRVLPDEEFEAGARDLLERLARGPTHAYAGVKRQLNGWLYAEMARQLDLEAEIQQGLAATRDFDEGVAAFRERREAMFEGD
jgi:2-(1,2-epoxy-1,2-dihydrophenyl)acetyl-CoA isomerase